MPLLLTILMFECLRLEKVITRFEFAVMIARDSHPYCGYKWVAPWINKAWCVVSAGEIVLLVCGSMAAVDCVKVRVTVNANFWVCDLVARDCTLVNKACFCRNI